jgi:hypothetical protein
MKVGLLAAPVISLALFAAPGAARGPKVEDYFKGQVVITTKRAPSRFPSTSAFVRFLQANKKKDLWPEKKKKDEWKYEFMAFFARPLNDIEVNIKFYDVTDVKKFVASDSFYLPERGQRVFASSMTLNKPRFSVNRKYTMMIVSARQQSTVLASATFWLRGEREHYSGKVTFTDDETKAGGGGDKGGEDD